MANINTPNKSDQPKLYNLDINTCQDTNNMDNTNPNHNDNDNNNNQITINAFSPSSNHPNATLPNLRQRSSTFSTEDEFEHKNNDNQNSDDTDDTEYTEAQQKFNYHYNLLVYMRHPQQHARIAYDAQISATFISIWCIFNMFSGFSGNSSLQLIQTTMGNINPLSIAAQTSNIEKLYHHQEIFYNLLVFLIAILVIHKDIICCNAQLCMPMLLLFNFVVRFSIQYVIKFEFSWVSVNCAIILVLLWFMCCRFFFNIFKSSKYDIHWNLMRCHFFYRGFYIRWISYLIYSWFNSLMVLQLMDSVCLSDGQLKTKLCQVHRIKFIGCDMVIVIYCIMVLGIWNRLQYVDCEHIKQYHKLNVPSAGVKELFMFIGVLVLVNFLCEGFLTKLIAKKMMLPFTVVLILVSNFLMR